MDQVNQFVIKGDDIDLFTQTLDRVDVVGVADDCVVARGDRRVVGCRCEHGDADADVVRRFAHHAGQLTGAHYPYSSNRSG